METKANYVIVGAFTVLVFLAAFAFVYWTARINTGGDSRRLDVLIEGSVTGLSVGSVVKFNGIDVGRVTRLRFDPDNPRLVIAETVIGTPVPLTRRTKATLGFTGLTGIAHIEFEGAGIDSPDGSFGPADGRSVFQIAEQVGGVAEIEADPSAVNNLLATAQDIFDRTDSVLTELEGFVRDTRAPLTQTLNNATEFTNALTQNSEQIEEFMAGIGDIGSSLQTVSARLDSVLQSVDELIVAVEPERVSQIVENVERVTANVAEVSADLERVTQDISTRVNNVLANVDGFVAESRQPLADALANVNSFTQTFADNQESVDKFLASAGGLGETLTAATARLDSVLDNVDRLVAGIEPERVTTIIGNVETLTGNLDGVSGDLQSLLDTAETTISGFENTGTQVNRTLERIDGVLGDIPEGAVEETMKNIAAAGESTRKAADEVAAIAGDIGGRRADIDKAIGDIAQMAERLNAASVRVDGVLAKVDGFLGEGDASNLLAEAQSTLTAFRNVANTLNRRLDGITAGLERFSGSGLRDIEGLVADTRRSINRIEGAISTLEQNPQRLIFGGEDSVKRFDGTRQRR